MIVTQLDPVDCQIMDATKEELRWTKDIMSYPAVFVMRKQYEIIKNEYNKTLVFGTKKKGYYFPAGLLPRLVKAAKKAA